MKKKAHTHITCIKSLARTSKAKCLYQKAKINIGEYNTDNQGAWKII